jgi:hypothetical protein
MTHGVGGTAGMTHRAAESYRLPELRTSRRFGYPPGIGMLLPRRARPAKVRTGVLNFSTPGPFEPDMPGIVEWFVQNPPKDTDT